MTPPVRYRPGSQLERASPWREPMAAEFPGLKPFWDKSMRSAFVRLDEPPVDAPMQERHRIYSLLLMGIVLDRWNGNKYGEVGDYGQWRANQLLARSPNIYRGGTYQGTTSPRSRWTPKAA
ncbi:hypothetical protein ACWC9T_07830 [Kitasatospora sp. NPDC001159]